MVAANQCRVRGFNSRVSRSLGIRSSGPVENATTDRTAHGDNLKDHCHSKTQHSYRIVLTKLLL